ncbi:type II toxin-antitoxin system RelE/ParE family toxin [Halioxenophilus aromaticivorans]|uniref:Type II toxin-antitoxin system RelE/ParE family toxin n=1 Tax=Halioxenophilus aromaticivorans TaxID=1306992 RepID=A0AAV3U3K3_9ALTE
MTKAIEFIETSIFTRQIKELATDELRELQTELIANPTTGALIVGTGGLRKIRLATGGKGKSGGSRIIYFVATEEVIYLVLAYPKSTKETLSSADKAALKSLVKQLKEE